MNNPKRIQFTNGRSAQRDACQSKNVTKYVYSATGEKLRTIYQTAVPNITVAVGTAHELTAQELLYADSTDYYHGGKLTVKNGRLDKYYFDGGYAQATMDESNQSDDFAFFYYTVDHLGNIREVIDEKGDVVQITNYYPFGTPYSAEDCATLNPDQQNHKYNGKEFDTTHGLNTYDYGARQYNSLVGRWDRVDPLCEKYYSVSPYAYCHNNPVMLIDPNGMDDYYDIYGNYIGTNGAETDYIYIANNFKPLEDGGYVVWTDTRVALPDAELSAEALSKILTCSVNWMSDVDVSKLEDGQINVVKWSYGNGNTIDIDDTYGNFYSADGETNAKTVGNNITAYIHDGNKKLFETRSNIQNMLGVHEYRNHFFNQLHHDNREDNIKLFNDVMSDPTWKKTTDYYKENEIRYRNYYLK